MFDKVRLKDALVSYKQNFAPHQWPNEKCKWEAVKWFQDNWDINASDFADMLTRSLAKTYNLLASVNNFPAKMIENFAQVQYDKHTLHSSNLYQIFTYVKNKDSEFGEVPHVVSGLLLYAKTEEEIQPDNSYQMSGNKISERTLDLNHEFAEIAKQLNAIAEEHFGITVA